jgi:sugar/nucleoside kinase (ribokinase family)
MNAPKVVIVGHVCIDHNTTEHAEYTKWGSIAMYMADYLQRGVQVKPAIITTYGSDFIPHAKGFDLYPAAPQVESTLLNENNTRGNKRIFYSHNVEHATPPVITPELAQLIGTADIFALAPLLPNYSADYVKDVVALVKPGALRVLPLQGYLRDVDESGLIHPKGFTDAAHILPLFDLAVMSDDDHPQAFEVARSWKNLSPMTNIIVTEGPLGASIVEKDTSHNIPTQPVPPQDIIDSVGCGDIFTAAVAYHYYQSHDMPAAIEAAHHAARAKLTAKSN